MNGANNVVKIFLPSQCLSHSTSGLLLGNQDLDRKLCCITGIVPVSNENLSDLANISQLTAGRKLSVVGVWECCTDASDGAKSATSNPRELGWRAAGESEEGWIVLRSSGGELPSCELQKSWKSLPENSTIVILYNAAHLANSEYLLTSSKAKEGCVQQSPNLAFLASSYLVSRDCLAGQRTSLPVEDFTGVGSGICGRVCNWLYFVLLSLLSGCCRLLLASLQTRLFNNRVAKFLGTLPACLLQLHTKGTDLASLRPTPGISPPLRSRSRLWAHIVDTCLGLVLMYWLLQAGTTCYLGQALITWANNVVSELQQLLQWLMGVPAGLKLNSQLDQFLGKFFMYHVYLWTGYLQFLRPILSNLLWYISLTGCLGVSVQLSLLQDLVSMMTLHIYCFYVYAARLYSLQLHCLGSLWRLFRGKKWNVLRKRVDSASFDVDQLFIGTLLFTILLFLLPTIALYYVVFMGLRVLVLSIQGILYQVVSILNSLPVYAVYLWMFQSQTVTDDVQFYVLESSPNGTIYLTLQLMPASLCKLWKDFGERNLTVKYTWSDLAHKLMSGHLVYPWIEPADSKQKTD